LPELLRDGLHQMIQLAGDGLKLGRERILHFLAHRGQLRFLAPARRPEHERNEHDCEYAGSKPD
jgi:hypothetical protein